MELLSVTVLNGNRQNYNFKISSDVLIGTPRFWIQEDEAIKFELILPIDHSDVCIQLYDHLIEPSYSELQPGNKIRYIWKPKRRGKYYESLFFNYFGIAELTILFSDLDNQKNTIQLEPIDILSSKSKADNVESMITYLSSLGENKLHSLFQTTKFGAGFREGLDSPISYLERLEKSIEKIAFYIHKIIRKPIKKLVPTINVVNPGQDDQLDDSSISWLMENLSVLESINNSHEAHLSYEERFYRASSIQISNISENTYLYENEVVHSALAFLRKKATEQMETYKGVSRKKVSNQSLPNGYVSFFSQVLKLKTQLLGNQLNRCLLIIEKISKLQTLLNKKIPVSKVPISRPMLTAKAASNIYYKSIFSEFIYWWECNKPDWSLYQNLMAITSIPKLFELYSYYRIETSLNKLTNTENLSSWEINQKKLTLHYEPIYWMNDNSLSNESNFINIEGSKIDKKGNISKRSHKSRFSHRSPDLVIEIYSKETGHRLIILDAKYTYASKAMSHYLPECTMKYIHGISTKEGNRSPVWSLTIIYPDELGTMNSFHSEEYSIHGNNSVIPALQCLGLELKPNLEIDRLTSEVRDLLIHSGVEI